MYNLSLSIVFFGSAKFSVAHLRALVQNNFNVCAVVTQQDSISPKGLIQRSPVKSFALERNIPVFEDLSKLHTIHADIFIVVAYGKILPPQLLHQPKFGAINVHASLLPYFRGPSPIQAAILHGAQRSGVSIILLDEKVDHGPLLCQKSIKLSPTETGQSLHDKLALLGTKLLIPTLSAYTHDQIQPKPQNHAKATYCKMLSRANGHINWNKPAVDIERMIRAYYPWPSTFSFLGKKRLKIHSAILSDVRLSATTPGSIQEKNLKLFVKTKDASIELTQVQIEGKSRQCARDFIHGYRHLLSDYNILS